MKIIIFEQNMHLFFQYRRQLGPSWYQDWSALEFVADGLRSDREVEAPAVRDATTWRRIEAARSLVLAMVPRDVHIILVVLDVPRCVCVCVCPLPGSRKHIRGPAPYIPIYSYVFLYIPLCPYSFLYVPI